MVNAFNIAKDEKKEWLITDNLSKDNVYPITKINNTTDCKMHSTHITKTHDRFECRVHLQRSKPKIKCHSCDNDHFPRTAQNYNKNKNVPISSNMDQNPSLHSAFSTNTHTPLDMWQNIKKNQVTSLKLSHKRSHVMSKNNPQIRHRTKDGAFCKRYQNNTLKFSY